MTGDSIWNALQKLEAGTVKKRDEGVSDLRQILNRIQSTSKIHELREYGWHKILDTLFALVKGEKHDLLSGSASAKKRAAGRLSTTAEALRLTVNLSTPHLRHKTAYAVLDHVNDSLDFEKDNEEPFRQLIRADYLKILRIVIANESHGEHLRAKDWERYVDLVLSAINAILADGPDDDEDDDISASGDFVFSASARTTLPVRPTQTSGTNGTRSYATQAMEDLMVTLMNLCSFSNAPLRSRLTQISETVLRALSNSLQVRAIAFKCLNTVLSVALTEDTFLVSRIATRIIVLMRHLWSSKYDPKAANLQEQMLTSLLLIRHLLQQDVLARAQIEITAVESLARTISEEYENRNEQNLLQVSDLVFSHTKTDDMFQRGGVAPDLDLPSATLHWITVTMIATLRSAHGHQFMSNDRDEVDLASARKRQKRSLHFADLVCWLILDLESIDLSQALSCREALLSETSDDQTTRSSWALLVLARLSKTPLGQKHDLHDFWHRVWRAASNLVTSQLNSRAACFTMMTLLDSGQVNSLLSSSDLINYCFHGGIRGPVSLTDSAMLFFSSCLRSSSLDTERKFQEFRDKVLAWLDTVWHLPVVRDHPLNVEVARMGQSYLLHDLIRALIGESRMPGQKQWIVAPPLIYQAYLEDKGNEYFAGFIVDPSKAVSAGMSTQSQSVSGTTQGTARLRQSRMSVFDFLIRKLGNFHNAFRKIESATLKQDSHEDTEKRRRMNLSVEIAEIVASACTVAALNIEPKAIKKAEEDVMSRCWECVVTYITLHRQNTMTFEDSVLRITQRLLGVWPSEPSDHLEMAKRRLRYVRSLQELLSRQEQDRSSADDMDLEFFTDPGNSQPTQSKSQGLERDIARRDVSFSTSTHGLFEESRILLLRESLEADLANNSKLASAMVDRVIALTPNDLLASRGPFMEYLNDKCALSNSDASRLLRHIAKVCLEADEFERNEAALCYCLKILTSLAHLWVSTEEEELADIAFDIYSWFIEIALGKGIASTKVMRNISDLLDCLFKTQSRYGTETLPSPRTSLLHMLKTGQCSLKFQIVPSLTHLFEGYVLTEHAAVFDDIVDRLPTEPDDYEGIAVRLYILASLGSRWGTVLRQAVYHIFETAANVPAATQLARASLQMMAREVGLEGDPRRLLHFFSPQVFYTWLEEGSLRTIPFSAFGYTTLLELVKAEKEELVAQAVLRQNLTHKELLEEMLQQSWPDILEENFPLAQVYAIATDMVENRAGADVGPVEDSMRSDLGSETYTTLAQSNFAEATALIILTLSDDRSIDKVLASSSRYKTLAETNTNIRQKGHSSTTHPPRQQPSFRAKYLMQILLKLCRAADTPLDSLWNPALLIYVYRKILDDAIPALGPLHVASVVRRIRIAVTLAGDVALEGYPLEMLLRALMPFLTHFHCSEDTVGICWYVLEYGSTYLESNLSFLLGLSVSIFTSLSVFTASSQESTTQESQFVSTMSMAKDFRTWLGQYLMNMRLVDTEGQRTQHFYDIVRHAKDVTKSGTSDKNETEGVLLHHLLIDQAAKKPLVSKEFFEIIIRTLSTEFRPAEDYSSEVVSEEADIIASVPVLWSTVTKMRVSGAFRTWSGKVLGKAYNIQGPLLKLAEYDHNTLPVRDDTVSLDQHGSIHEIVSTLACMIWHEEAAAAGMAERTLSIVLGTIGKKDRQTLLSTNAEWVNLEDLVFETFSCPAPKAPETVHVDMARCLQTGEHESPQHWASAVAELLIEESAADPFLNGLVPMLRMNRTLGECILPMVVHLVLDSQAKQQQKVRETLSKLCNTVFQGESTAAVACSAILLKVILYLRRCIYPGEANFATRNKWLEIDFRAAATAALNAKMPDTALLMVEISNSEHQLPASSTSRRSSVRIQSPSLADEMLLPDIYRQVSDGDFFYGSHEESNIHAVLAKLRHENEGTRVLALESAMFDAATKVHGLKRATEIEGEGIVTALSLANLHGLTYVAQQYTGCTAYSKQQAYVDNSLLNIHQWDIPMSGGDKTYEASLQAVLQKVEILQNKRDIIKIVDDGICHTMNDLTDLARAGTVASSHLIDLAAMSTVEQMLSETGNGNPTEPWMNFMKMDNWVGQESFPAVSKILMAREAVCAAMRRNEKSDELFRTSQGELLLSEIRSVRASLAVAKMHDATQFCLNRAAYLYELQDVAQKLELDVSRAITYDIASTLWSQGEITAPIEMLKSIENTKASEEDALPMSKSEILTDLGQKLSQARLHRPDEIMKRYLLPAIDTLDKNTDGTMVGRVYHNFAVFCDEQLRDSVAKDDFERISKIRNKKQQEIHELAEYCKNSEGKERESFKMAYSKAKTWFKLDDEEYRRLKTNREALLRNSLENYLLSIQACDDYGKDVLRFLSLWLGNPKVQAEESSIREYLRLVPSLKLAPFVNQLSSRLADNGDPFQKTLFETFFRVCRDHPFHSLYQLFSVFKSKGAKEDDAAKSRQKAADRLAKSIQGPDGKTSSQAWISVHNSNIVFVNFAQEKSDKAMRTGKGIPLRSFQYGKKLEQTIQGLSRKIPPPTLKIALRRDRDYSSLPTFTTFEPDIVVAGGVSAPKITTIIASDGTRHKMLLKGGNDDLRQDAIMEQVFEQVSDLLRDHRTTRQRKLGIRTYKVIPLTHNAGIIEFVKNTIPLHEYLLPAHVRYFPKDHKPNACRQQIANAQTKSTKERIKTFEGVISHFHPVMRFFFMEHFLDPDDWFNKRLAYSRSTAAISILGHVLGLGDRHGHNILLDEQSGEVVHIDLGVAFEAGRVLPVPEVVPFRLTRDLVDGMGLSGVEGPFKRCCNFTLEALRKNQDVIMTILDVLRWDPLYSWSVSLLRVHRMQDAQERENAAAAAAASTRDETPAPVDKNGKSTTRTKTAAAADDDKRDGNFNVNEPGEADRALSVVAKKLSAGLSVEATVNELIRQATDVDNLAVLYCGWAAYA